VYGELTYIADTVTVGWQNYQMTAGTTLCSGYSDVRCFSYLKSSDGAPVKVVAAKASSGDVTLDGYYTVSGGGGPT
jgi:hypothetical protein